MAWHAAPTLLGLKTASLLIFNSKNGDISTQIKQFNVYGQTRGLFIRVLYQNENRQWLYIYNKSMLLRDIRCADRALILGKMGYSRWLSSEDMLERLSLRMAASQGFPHEIGLFLGYPVADVTGFIKNRGKHGLLNGCWIVYSDVIRAKRLFDCFHIAQEYLSRKIEQGFSLAAVLKHVHDAYI